MNSHLDNFKHRKDGNELLWPSTMVGRGGEGRTNLPEQVQSQKRQGESSPGQAQSQEWLAVNSHLDKYVITGKMVSPLLQAEEH